MSVLYMATQQNLKFLRQPYDLFIYAALLMLIYSFFTKGQGIDFHVQDTYFVVSAIFFIWAIALLLLVGWALYKSIQKVLLTKYLTWVHVIATLLVLALLMTLNLWHNKILPPVERQAISFKTLLDDQQRELKVAIPIAIIFFIGQASFVVNLIGGLVKRLT